MGFGSVIKLNKRGYALIGLLFIISLYFHLRNKPSDKEQEISLPYLLKTAVQAAVAGGKLVVSTRENIVIQSKGKTREGMDDSVTTADFLSHCAMEKIITTRLPAVRFISEEKHAPCDQSSISKPSALDEAWFHLPNVLVKASDVTVWIDPLDATHEYTEKLYQYVTTMVCVAIKGEAIIGVIHNPFNETTYWAVSGYGHSNNLNPSINKDHSDKIRVIISRSHSGTIKEVLKNNFQNTEIVVAAGAGYKVIEVANGNVDAYLHNTAIKKWDICAGNAILNALGGKMTMKHGKSLTYYNETDVVNEDGLIATMKNHELFVDRL